MSRDPYDPCPCGSGNKLKFCCADVAAEMDKVERLLGNNQPHMAIQAMEKLRKAHPKSQWVSVCLASTLINDERSADAKQVLKPLLKEHPEQPFANALYALASYNADGYPACKRAVQRAFKQSTQSYPDLVGTLAHAVAESLLSSGNVMAARQYLVIAMRLGREEHRRELFEELMELDGDTTVAYPLRGVRQPMEFDAEGVAAKPARLAARLAAVGCFDEAADTLQTIAEGRPDDPRLTYDVGLFRAWAGDHAAAIAAFRKASALFDSSADAVECETLAQCLEQADPDRGTPLRLRRYNVKSISQLLSNLDRTERFVRMDRDQEASPREATSPVALYVFLSRPVGENEIYAEWDWKTVPLIEGRLTIFDSDPQGEQPAQVFLTGLEGDELERVTRAFEAAAVDLAKAVQPASEAEAKVENDVSGYIPEFEVPLRWSGFVPPEAPGAVARETARQRWHAVIDEVWPHQKLSALGERSPVEAANDADAAVKLEAALIVFDAYADTRGYMLPIDALRERLSLPMPQPLAIDEQTNLNSLSTLAVHRLQASALSAAQLEQLIKRATVVRHSRLLYDVLRESLQRPDQMSDADTRDRVVATLASLCGSSLRQDETLEWIAKGRAAASQRRNTFEALLEWKMRELTLRIANPDDPQLQELLRDLWHHYGAKLPQLREYLVTMVEVAGVTPPWESAIVTPAGAMAGGAESWSQPQESAGAKKLWLPGSGD